MYYQKGNRSAASSSSEPENESEDLFRSKVHILWQQDYLTDVTLSCGEKLLTAHKLVLSAYSDYFKKVFSTLTPTQYPVIFMKDCSPDILQAILEFMYCGEVNVAECNLKAFIKLAHTLKIKGINMEDEEPVPEIPSGKKRRQNSNTEKQYLPSSPPTKKLKPPPMKQYERSDSEDADEEDGEEFMREEQELKMSRHNRHLKRPQPLPALRQSDLNNERKRNNSIGNSSHSSQQSRSSMVKPLSVRNRPQEDPLMKQRLMKTTDKSNHDAASELGFSDDEDMEDDNATMSDDNMEEEESNENVLKTSTRSRIPPRKSSDYSQDEPRRSSTLLVRKFQPKISRSPEELFANPKNEERLNKIISYMTQITPLTPNQVKIFAWGIDCVSGENAFDDSGPSKEWWGAFKRKNVNVHKVLRSYDFLKESNLSPEMFSFEALSQYLIPVQEIIEAFDINGKPENFWSCSEYTINCNGSDEDCVRPSRERFLDGAHFPPDGDYASVMFAGSASGQKIAPFTVFKNISPDDNFTEKGPHNAIYGQNSTGFIDSVLLMEWFEDCFLPQCPKTRSEDNPMVLLLNSCFPLVAPEMLDLAFKENVILLSLMPHLHHTCQPMDAAFSRGFREHLKEKIKTSGTQDLKDDLPNLMKDPFDKGITSDLIMEGFKICGILPLAINVDQQDYLQLRKNLNFDKYIMRRNPIEKQPVLEKAFPSRKSKLLPKSASPEMNTSDEEEEEMMEETNGCYVCGKDFPPEGKMEEGKWFQCSKRHCKNVSCEECLPLNYEKTQDYICIDCNR